MIYSLRLVYGHHLGRFHDEATSGALHLVVFQRDLLLLAVLLLWVLVLRRWHHSWHLLGLTILLGLVVVRHSLRGHDRLPVHGVVTHHSLISLIHWSLSVHWLSGNYLAVHWRRHLSSCGVPHVHHGWRHASSLL